MSGYTIYAFNSKNITPFGRLQILGHGLNGFARINKNAMFSEAEDFPISV